MEKEIPEPFHPGEYLKDELKERGWTEEDLAKKIEQPLLIIKHILLGQYAITPDLAKRLGEVLGTSSEVWLNLQAVYDLTKKIQLAQKIDKELAKREWLKSLES